MYVQGLCVACCAAAGCLFCGVLQLNLQPQRQLQLPPVLQQPASPPAPRPASPTKSPAAAKSAAKTPGRRSAAAAAARPSDEVEARTPATTSRKAPGSERLLQTASKTPLPATPPTNGSIPPSPLTTARKPRRAAAPKPAVGRVLLLAAAVAALSALAIPACQKYECSSRLREQFPGAVEQAEQLGGWVAGSLQAALPAGLLEAASEHYSQAHALALHHWQNAQRQCTYLVHTTRLWVEERLQVRMGAGGWHGPLLVLAWPAARRLKGRAGA